MCNINGASQVALVVNNTPAKAGDVREVGLIPASGRSPGVGNATPLQYACLERIQYSCLPGQRSLAGYSPCGHKELDTIQRLSTVI